MQTPKGEIHDAIMKLLENETLLEQMSAAGSPEACYALVKDELGISFEEFQSSMSVAMAYVKDSKSGELSEDDLDAVAGGKGSSKGPAVGPFKPGLPELPVSPTLPQINTAATAAAV